MKTNHRKLNVALVDDNRFYLNIMECSIKKNTNSKVFQYTSSAQFMEEMQTKSPDIVFLDYNLEDNVSGLDILSEVKISLPNSKIIMMSSSENMNSLYYSLELGADGYIFKDKNSTFSVLGYIRTFYNREDEEN